MIYIIFFGLSLAITYGIKEYATKKSIMDIPNERSSHHVATPRGGGLSIIILFYLGIFYFHQELDRGLFYALLCALPIAGISLLDDFFTLSSSIRLSVQAIASFLALYMLGGIDSIDLLFVEVEGWWINIFAFFSILWLTNLYNFLDGIDGYAGSQAVMIGLGLFVFFNYQVGLVIAISSVGFLFFNWHKASLFMGDVGSATLGFIFAIFVFSDTSEGNIYTWLVLLCLFWFDATLTLWRRYRQKESLIVAHKKHAYQRLVQSGWSHERVVIFSICLNVLFFLALYSIDAHWLVFLLALVTLYIIVKWVDKRKAFS